MSETRSSVHQYFAELTDPRKESHIHHLLLDILFIALCAVICGAESFYDMELFAKSKNDFFCSFLDLPNGIPSHDTFNRILSRLSPDEFRKCFIKWSQALSQKLKGVVAIDGKTLRRSFDSASKKMPIHLVSAWSAENRMVFGQIKTAAKSNEITAIPELIALLDLEGCIVTIDAMGCQKNIAQKILEAGADYILGLKGNQGNTFSAAKILFECEEKDGFEGVSHTSYETLEKEHGRIERREIHSVSIPEDIEEFRNWPGLQSITKVISTREIIGKGVSTECRYYLSSLAPDAELIGKAIRAHWGIENSLHWVLDVDFREDYARNRKDHSAENLAILRHMALNFIRKDASSKTSLRGRRLKAGWDTHYLIKLLSFE
jgi:predicted transposase YbfD/YdcC